LTCWRAPCGDFQKLGDPGFERLHLALSFDWYSKAWWPRTKIEEFARTHGKLSRADTARLFEESLAAVDSGLKLTQKVGKQIPGFAVLAATLIKLWTSRMATFRAN
jgi:hypothetical protein